MEEFENEFDKGIYWIIFFVILIVIAVIGYNFVFKYGTKETKKKSETVVNEIFDVDQYKGVWQLFGDADLPEQELCINIIDGSTITFDYYIKDLVYFDSQTASLEDEKANFIITDRQGTINIEGSIIFKNDKIFFAITSTSFEQIPLGTFQFLDKSDESLLK